jgi:hypothetical protein
MSSRRGCATDETVFLHPPGVDDQCEEARASISGRRAGPSRR